MPTLRRQQLAVRDPRSRKTEHFPKPHARTLKLVVGYLEEIGLSVYGPNHNLETGTLHLGHRDYTPQEVVAYRRRWHNNTLGDYPEELREEEAQRRAARKPYTRRR